MNTGKGITSMDTIKKLGKRIGVLLLALMLNNAAMADTVTYFHNDISGSPMAATDATGNLLWKENYKPYGERLNQSAPSSSNKIGFHGKPFDDATGLSYMGARYYDPVLGRFMGVDPVDFQASNLHSFNRYTYANNNPYKYIDPDGRFAFLIVPAFYALTALAAAATVSAVIKGRGSDDTVGGRGVVAFETPVSQMSDVPRTTTYHNEKAGGEEEAKQSSSKSDKGQRTRGRPWKGEPGSTTDRDAGGNARRFGRDGLPEVDYDAPHPNEAGVGSGHHTHNWDRPPAGLRLTNKDRNISTPYSPLPKR
ncbi:RHS repeat-associated core domain-containing protein [Pseudomonas orientalis]|uniref:RHS repeat-associated core domain-containing protein n=1 Tax=Pseudomonas orientalis TaxID=76758 RepID=UPI002FE1591D